MVRLVVRPARPMAAHRATKADAGHRPGPRADRLQAAPSSPTPAWWRDRARACRSPRTTGTPGAPAATPAASPTPATGAPP